MAFLLQESAILVPTSVDAPAENNISLHRASSEKERLKLTFHGAKFSKTISWPLGWCCLRALTASSTRERAGYQEFIARLRAL